MSQLGQRLKKPQAVIFLCWSAAIVWLVLGGRYQLFLRPSFWFLLVMGFVVLFAFLVVTLLKVGATGHAAKGPIVWTRFALLMLPLLYLIAAGDTSLGSHAFRNRSAPVDLVGKIKAQRTLEDLRKDNKLTLLEILQYFKEYEGKQIVTEGMVYKGEDVPDRHFLIFRFLMICCAADALPAGALVAHDRPEEFESDSWVRVEGTLGLKFEGELVWPSLQPEEIVPIDQPDFPYLIPALY